MSLTSPESQRDRFEEVGALVEGPSFVDGVEGPLGEISVVVELDVFFGVEGFEELVVWCSSSLEPGIFVGLSGP